MFRRRKREPSHETYLLLMRLFLEGKLSPLEFGGIFQHLIFYKDVDWGRDAWDNVLGPGFDAAETYWWQDGPIPEDDDFFTTEEQMREEIAAILAKAPSVRWHKDRGVSIKRDRVHIGTYTLFMKIFIEGRLTPEEFAEIYRFSYAYDYTQWGEERDAIHKDVLVAIDSAGGDRDILLPLIEQLHTRAEEIENRGNDNGDAT